MKRPLLIIIVIALYLLHQDIWFWRTAEPIIFGILPIGLFYHVCYTLAVSIMMWLLVKYAWPSQLEERAVKLDKEKRRQGDKALSPSPLVSLSSTPPPRSQSTEGRQ